MKQHLLSVLYATIFILALFFLIGCESPTAPHKDRTKQTIEIRNHNGGRN